MNDEEISPTAKVVAYLRSFTDIMYAKKIAADSYSKEAVLSIFGDDLEDLLWVSAFIEARHKSIFGALAILGCDNILELASGLSPRGLEITKQHSSIHYIESDLPEMIREKRLIASEIMAEEPRQNIDFLEVDALNLMQVIAAANSLPAGPVAFVTEGLLPYFYRRKKGIAATIIRSVLARRGGFWITPDVSDRSRIQAMLEIEPRLARLISIISGITKRNIETNAFADMADADNFFAENGLSVRKYEQQKLITNLSSLDILNVGKEERDKVMSMLSRGVVWVMEAR